MRVKVPQARDDGFLALLLGSVGSALRLALDFRHDSWDDPEVQARLDEHGAVRAGALDGAAPFRYLRFRDPPYDEAALAGLAAEIRPLLAEGVEVYGYFRHEDEPTAPAYARAAARSGRGRVAFGEKEGTCRSRFPSFRTTTPRSSRPSTRRR